MEIELLGEEGTYAGVGDLIVVGSLRFLIIDLLKNDGSNYTSIGYSAVNLVTSCKIYRDFSTIKEVVEHFYKDGQVQIIKSKSLTLIEV